MPYRRSIATLLALGAVAGLAACGGSGSSTSTSARTGGPPPTIVVRNEEPVNGVETLEYSAGEQVEFKVKSNTATEVHIHGYEIEKNVAAGGTVTLSFPAELEGIYDVEVHPAEEQIAELRVNP
jgi:ABC-type glycerol-3-phosphate transport system substrate-binding protein